MPKNTEIAFVQLNLETGALPDDLTREVYLECKESKYWDIGDGRSFKIFGADLSCYDGIIVWHSKDVRRMLILAMISALYNGKILSCDVIHEDLGNVECVYNTRKQVYGNSLTGLFGLWLNFQNM